MQNLSHLTPHLLWQFFDRICSIPHPSHHEEALAQYIVDWAKQNEFFVERDSVGNILIRKPATPGLESLKPVVLQAHLDMVPQKNEGTEHDFAKDPIQTYIEDGWVKAKGTTLGADNGIGMASALAVLVDESVTHGPIEVLLTMTEETGMDGAFGLQPNWLQGEILINTDSETDGEVYMGCAGGIDAVTTLALTREALQGNYQTLQISMKGLKGGHSGADIHLGLGNANKLLARFLARYQDASGLRLISFNGGTLRNAIPREAVAIVAVPADKVQTLETSCAEFAATLHNELSALEKNLSFKCQAISCQDKPLTVNIQKQLIALINGMPNGVIRMSDAVEGVVETSLNVGVISTTDDKITIVCLIRSLIDSGKEYIVEVLHSLSSLAGAGFSAEGGYPGWQPNPQSAIMQIVNDTYRSVNNKAPEINVIHAGLECGLFKKSYPNMDMVSIGPTIRGPHSPDERVEIASVENYWKLLTQILKAIPKR